MQVSGKMYVYADERWKETQIHAYTHAKNREHTYSTQRHGAYFDSGGKFSCIRITGGGVGASGGNSTLRGKTTFQNTYARFSPEKIDLTLCE